MFRHHLLAQLQDLGNIDEALTAAWHQLEDEAAPLVADDLVEKLLKWLIGDSGQSHLNGE